MISADSHIIEPGDLRTSRIDSAYRERGPHIEMQGTLPDGTVEESQFMVVEGGTPQHVAGFTVANVDPKDRLRPTGAAMSRSAPEPEIRSSGYQDIDGIVSEVIYPSMAMPYFSLPDVGLQQAVFRAYNDWTAEFCSHSPQRLVGLAMICTDDVETACSELRRARSLGLRGALIPNSWRPSPAMPIRPSTLSGPPQPNWACRSRYTCSPAATDLPACRRPLARLVHGLARSGDEVDHLDARSSVFSRAPDLKMISVENDIGWFGYYLYRLQHGWDEFRYVLNLEQELSPNEYFAKNV